MDFGIMLLGVIVFLCFLHHKQRRINPIVFVLQLRVTVTTEVTSLRLRLMAVFWGAGRVGDMRQEGSVGEVRRGKKCYCSALLNC